MARGGARKGAGRKSSYEAYSSQYDDKAATLAAHGVSMYQRKYTKAEWQAQHLRLTNERKAAGRKPGNINRDLVEKQAYGMTKKQVDAILKDKKKELKRKGYNSYQIRSGEWIEAELTKERSYYERLDWDEDAIETALKGYISTEYFGS